MNQTGGDDYDKYVPDAILCIGTDILLGVCLFLAGAVFGFSVFLAFWG